MVWQHHPIQRSAFLASSINSIAKVSAYFELTKPRALASIVYTTALSYLIAATETVVMGHLLRLCLGVCVAAAGSLALNQFMERKLDAQMKRTASRPLPSGRLSPSEALVYGMVLMVGGYVYLWIEINPACSLATAACGFSYLVLYTPLKLRSSFSSFVGAIPGALLPVMGWVAIRNKMEMGMWVLFALLFIWQIPHALIISIRHQQDYQAVGMKQLPIISSALTSRRQLMLNVAILIPLSLLPVFLNMTEQLYPILALALGFGLFAQSIIYTIEDTPQAARRLFIGLTAYLPLLLLVMYFDKPS